MKLKIFLTLLVVLFLIWFTTVLAQSTDIKSVPEAPKPLVATSTPEFERIAHCESYDANLGHNDLHAKSKTSSASGEFQFINSSWFHYGKELWGDDFYEKNIWSLDNRELAWYVYKKYGTHDWDASKYCWGKV